MSNKKMRVKIILNFLLLSIYVYFVLLNAVQGNWQTTLAWGCCVLSWCSERRYICIIEKMINLDEQADEILKESVDFFKKCAEINVQLSNTIEALRAENEELRSVKDQKHD